MRKGRAKRVTLYLIILLLNVVLIFCVLYSVLNGFSKAEEASFLQNVENVRTLTTSAAEKVDIAITQYVNEVHYLSQYLNEYNGTGMTISELLDYFEAYYVDEDKSFLSWQLADSTIENRAFSAIMLSESEPTKVTYPIQSYEEMAGIFCSASVDSLGTEKITSEFTVPSPGLFKAFAITVPIRIKIDTGSEYKTLMLIVSSEYINSLIANDAADTQYQNCSNILINDSGDYIISSKYFQGKSIIDYLELYNDDFDESKQAQLLQKLSLNESMEEFIYLNNRGISCIYTIVPISGENWNMLSVVPISSFHNGYDYTGNYLPFALYFVLLTFLDIGFILYINIRLRRSMKEANAANVAKTKFLSSMSHDIRTPMNGIIGMTQLTRDIPNLPEEAKTSLATIASSSTYLLQIINDVLDMSKIESDKIVLNLKGMNICSVVDSAVETIRPIAEQKMLDLRLEYEGDGCRYVFADSLRMQQILMNLLSNSVKFTPNSGMVSVKVHLLPDEDYTKIQICVEDTGCGMSEEFLNRIYEPFSQESTQIISGQEGTGLGMSIVRSLVNMMGGTIEIESKLAEGTKFVVDIRLQSASEKDVEINNTQEMDVSVLDNKRILLAEDHPLNAKIAIRVLEKQSMIVEHAANGAIAVDMFEKSGFGYYDAILMDIRMPELNGLEATCKIRDMKRTDASSIPIIAMTANAYEEDVQATLDAGMNAHLAKPIDPMLLYQTLADKISKRYNKKAVRK